MGKKKTQEEFENEIYQLVGNEYTILGEYKNTNTKILIRHNFDTCENHMFEMRPADFLNNNQRCPRCNGNKDKNDELFKKEVFDKTNGEYLTLSPYVKSSIKVKFKHICDKCNNHEFEMTPNNFSRGQRCPKCFGTHKKTTEEFKEEVFKKYKSEYIVIGDYKNALTKIEIKHNLCGNSWSIKPTNLLSGFGCPVCYGNIKKTNEEYVEELFEVNPNIEALDEYHTNTDKLRFRCKLDNHIWITTADSVLRGHGCPVCNESKGEKKIRKYLLENKIKFEWQKSYDDLKGTKNGLLSYDFYLPKHNLLIEYQGEFHYGVAKKQTQEEFKIQQEHDKRKRDYAKDNNINLLEISYWEFKNIDEILKRELNINNLRQVV